MSPRTRPLAAPAALLLAVGLAACGSDEPSRAEPDPDADLVVLAEDNHFDRDAYEVAAGSLDVSYVERGALVHTLVIEGVDDFKLEVRRSKPVDNGTVELQPGTYLMYCDIPGHKPTMQAELTVT